MRPVVIVLVLVLALLIGALFYLLQQNGAQSLDSPQNEATVIESAHTPQSSAAAVPSATPTPSAVPTPQPVTQITLSQAQITLDCGQEQTLEYVTQPAANASELVWESSDGNVAWVEQGVVRGKAKGSAAITLRSKENAAIFAVCEVTVPNGPSAPLSPILPGRFIPQKDGVWRNAAAAQSGEATLMFTGDLMCLNAQIGKAKQGEVYNFNKSFDLVRDVFAQADFVMGNLESPVAYSFSFTGPAPPVPTPDPANPEAPLPKRENPVLNAPAAYLDALRYAGFDAVAMANNHGSDLGVQGIRETLSVVDNYFLARTGSFAAPEEPRFLLAEINGICVAFLSYADFYNAQIGADNAFMVNRFSTDQLQTDIATARTAGAEFIVVIDHWGEENTHTVSSTQKKEAQQMADAGADLILGSHSHCLQPAEVLTAQDGRRVPCVYSMGNFVSSMAREINNDTIIVQADLRRNDAGVELASLRYIPCRTYASLDGRNFVTAPITDKSGAAYARITGVMGEEEIWEP